jgi:hypothetical protein
VEKIAQRFTFAIKKLAKVNSQPNCDNSPNLVTLLLPLQQAQAQSQGDQIWANFRRLGDFVTWEIYFKLGLIFSPTECCLEFDEKRVGRHFGRIFQGSAKSSWSPCSKPMPTTY